MPSSQVSRIFFVKFSQIFAQIFTFEWISGFKMGVISNTIPLCVYLYLIYNIIK